MQMSTRSPIAARWSELGEQAVIPDRETATVVNDLHSQLNRTRVAGIVRPQNVDDLRAIVRRAGADAVPLSIAGGRHAMGGQQFGDGAVLLDTRDLDRVLALDPAL